MLCKHVFLSGPERLLLLLKKFMLLHQSVLFSSLEMMIHGWNWNFRRVVGFGGNIPRIICNFYEMLMLAWLPAKPPLPAVPFADVIVIKPVCEFFLSLSNRRPGSEGGRVQRNRRCVGPH